MKGQAVIVLCLLALALAGTAVAIDLASVFRDEVARIDCGPEGTPTLDGKACIDRNPVSVTAP